MSKSTAMPPHRLPDLPTRIWALIPCAGAGSRAGTPQPKQYQRVAGLPLVLHTLRAFAGVPSVAHTLVVVAASDPFFDASALDAALCSVAKVGGATRANTVLNGLSHLLAHGAATHDWVLVHDAARCLVTPTQIQALIDICLPDDVGGLLAHRLPDTLKSEVQGRVASTIDRTDKWLAQTPQMFRMGALLAALQLAGDKVTDEASAMEAAGLAPLLVPGSAQNFKVTYPEDFALAQAVLHARHRSPSTARHPKPEPYDYP